MREEFIMSGKQTGHDQGQAGGKRRSPIQQANPAEQETWKGGGREPIDPDDIDADGEYFGKNNPKQPLRSDDN
jgi:DNA-binding protein H-NS